MTGRDPPVLWHLKVSHYNEKVRWALDYKRVAHVRRAAVPGAHRRKARRLTGGDTLPVLVLDGTAIGDSTQIIAALEERFPEPALYPEDAAQRRRALELEDHFDEELGPYSRRLVVHSLLPSAELTFGAFFSDLSPARQRVGRALFPAVRRRMRTALTIDDESVDVAWGQLRAAGERFRSELQPSGYLVGDRFTVADLALAALVAPAIAPEQYPYPQPQRGHPQFDALRTALAQAGIAEWAREMYARHRGKSAEVQLSTNHR